MPTSAELQGQHLHFDCAAGCAGDMTIAALLHLGVPRSVVDESLERMGLAAARLKVNPVVKSGIASIDVKVDCSKEGEHSGEHGHDHHHYADIRRRIENADFSDGLRQRIFSIFERLAEVEAQLHGTTVDKVAFHEVGGLDSIVDIVGSAAALEWLAPESVSASAVAMGVGTVRCAHGLLPLPSPAALEIMLRAGALTKGGGIDKELCTPTGAAILAAHVTQWGEPPEMTPLGVGYGAGDRELPDRPNVLRVVIGRRPRGHHAADMLVVEANIDDMNPELCAPAAEAILAAGARDVWWTPISMKKGRPGWLLTAVVPQQKFDSVAEVMVRETSTIGLRYHSVARRVLDRETAQVTTPFGEVPMKIARLEGVVVNAAPEFEACYALAQSQGVTLKQIYAAALAAWTVSS